LHDLRHTGRTTREGRNRQLRELEWMGHSSLRAALICQHATQKRQRDEAIAAAMGELYATASREGRPRVDRARRRDTTSC
jgi:hypothetical protein